MPNNKNPKPCPKCQEQGIKSRLYLPAGLGSHLKQAHGISGSSPSVVRLRELYPPTGKMKCFYCDREFAGRKWRSRHINLVHPGMSLDGPEPQPQPTEPQPVLVAPTLNQVVNTTIPKRGRKPNGLSPNTEESLPQTIEEFNLYQDIAHATGLLEGIARGLADRKGYSQELFTSQCAKFLYRTTLR